MELLQVWVLMYNSDSRINLLNGKLLMCFPMPRVFFVRYSVCNISVEKERSSECKFGRNKVSPVKKAAGLDSIRCHADYIIQKNSIGMTLYAEAESGRNIKARWNECENVYDRKRAQNWKRPRTSTLFKHTERWTPELDHKCVVICRCSLILQFICRFESNRCKSPGLHFRSNIQQNFFLHSRRFSCYNTWAGSIRW